MTRVVAKSVISPRQGFAMCEGRKYLLVSKMALRRTLTGERLINAVHENAGESSPGYLPMTLLHIPDSWRRGGEAESCEPNGTYDYLMREQRGVLTPAMRYDGGPCHDD